MAEEGEDPREGGREGERGREERERERERERREGGGGREGETSWDSENRSVFWEAFSP